MYRNEKRAKVIDMIDDLYGDGGMAVVNMLMDYISEDDWNNLYDQLERDGSLSPDPLSRGEGSEDDDTPEEVREALEYVREQIGPVTRHYIRETVTKNLEHRLPAGTGLDEGKIIDLFEEYGDDNDLGECWWENYGDIEDWMMWL